MPTLQLSPAEARAIASLVEKSVTTPQYYPLTTHAVMLACNQRSCRSPVMSLREGDVGAALQDLAEKGLCQREEQGRAPRWRHALQHHLLLQPPALAVLATLMLRGPQTPAELRAHAAGLGGPGDAAGVTAVLNDLSDRSEPLVVLLPRGHGQKEARYMHTLCGPPGDDAPAAAPAIAPSGPAPAADGVAGLEARLRALEERVAALEGHAGSPPPAPG